MYKNKNVSKEIQEQETTARRTNILQSFILEALKSYGQRNKGRFPNQIIIYRDGVGGPTMEEKVKESEVNQVQQAIQSFAPGGMG